MRDTSSKQKLSPFPSANDIPLTPNAVYTLASAFIKSCPSTNPALPVKAYPAIAATAAGPAAAGQTVQIKAAAVLAPSSGTAKLYAAFITFGGPVFADLTPAGDGINFSVKVPAQGVAGQSYLVLCNCAERVDDGTIVAGPAVLEVTAA